MNVYKDNVDMTFEEFLENIAKMDFDDYILCIRSSLKAPKVFLKTKNKGNEDKLVLWEHSSCLEGKSLHPDCS